MQEIVWDRRVEARAAELVLQILEQESYIHFRELDDEDLWSAKHSVERRETEVQFENLVETRDNVWNSLLILCSSTNLDRLNLPYFDTQEKQNALIEAITDESINRSFLLRFIRYKWRKFLDIERPWLPTLDSPEQTQEHSRSSSPSPEYEYTNGN
ncbi:hypothetical protein N7532_000420 [Penicillium argentinense]|uniref:Uncharacterized protein n=1 Tax=Penicillium argentinense TaxID=1131581 RepID=A0A9W9G585_9EURO|nr:uncharacterized protein N7532_000420 [Penicillium argentinense]KAJ5112375.1 hypothetical protein N7532_000420 [Penicillium argentinense]